MAKFHIVTLFISMLSYTTSVVVVRTDNGHASRGASIAKVLLWILPIFVELAVHFFVNREFHRNISATSESKSTQPAQTNTNANENKDLKDWLQKEISSLIERADTVFVILLGVGKRYSTKTCKHTDSRIRFGSNHCGLPAHSW